MSEYSSLPGMARSKLVRAELEDPCTKKRTGGDGSPAFGAPTRLRQRLRFTSPFPSPFLAQYSPLQIGASRADAGLAVSAPPCPVEGKPPTSPPPAPSPATWSSVRRAIAWPDGNGLRS